MSDLLQILYQRVSNMTEPSCNGGIKDCARFQERKYRCCEAKYCELARRFAKEKYNIDLLDTGNKDLPFMGESGCTIAPYLRPICSLHVCSMAWAEGLLTGPPGYEELRDEIIAEAKRQGKEPVPCQ